MARKKDTTENDRNWRDYLIATGYSEAALQTEQQVGKKLGINPDFLPILENQKILVPADAQGRTKGCSRRYHLRDVIEVYVDRDKMEEVERLVREAIRIKNAKAKSKNGD